MFSLVCFYALTGSMLLVVSKITYPKTHHDKQQRVHGTKQPKTAQFPSAQLSYLIPSGKRRPEHHQTKLLLGALQPQKTPIVQQHDNHLLLVPQQQFKREHLETTIILVGMLTLLAWISFVRHKIKLIVAVHVHPNYNQFRNKKNCCPKLQIV